jgi:hypothetical protein
MTTPLTVTATTPAGSGAATFTVTDSSTVIPGLTSYATLPNKGNLSATLDQAAGVLLPAGDFTFTDFAMGAAPYNSGLLLRTCVTLQGAGIDKTVLYMVPNTSTKAAYANALTSGQTNALTYVLFDQGGSKVGKAVIVADCTVKGTPQGHLYIGLRTNGAKSMTYLRVKVEAIPGGAGVTPTETFPDTDWQVDQATYDTCEVTGLDANGVITSSSLIGVNSTNHLEVIGSTLHHSKAMGIAVWHTSSAHVANTLIDDVWRPVNLEQCGSGGDFVFDQVDFGSFVSRPGNEAIIQVNSYAGAPAGMNGSAKVQIIDPVWTPNAKYGGRFVVGVPATYPDSTHANTQLRSDVTLTINGQNRPDMLQFV